MSLNKNISLEKAVAYIKNEEAFNTLFNTHSLTADLEKTAIPVGPRTVRVQSINFDDFTMGDFDRVNGYPNKGFSVSWIDRTLTQDKGDKLWIDRMDARDSEIGTAGSGGDIADSNAIVTIHNRYIKEIEVPSIDTYRLAQIANAEGITKVNGTITSANVADAIFAAYQAFGEARISTTGLILYVNPAVDALLRKEVYSKSHINVGNWNGDLKSEVRMFETAKIITVPSSILGSDVNFILLHPAAVNAQKKYQETVFMDKTENYGNRRLQVCEGVFHDCWIEPNGEKGIYAHLKTKSAS